MALWALLVFGTTIILVALIAALTSWMVEPSKTKLFRVVTIGWIRFFLFMVGCPYKVRGKENFRKGKVYIVTVNHNSFLDAPVLTPFVPGPNKTIAKAEMARIPIFSTVYKRGSILVDRKNKKSRQKSFLQMVEVLKMGMHMCIYPEGTRNRTELPLKEFHNGAFRLSKDTGVAIIPAVIFNTKKILPANKGFYFKPHRIELHFLPPVQPSGFETDEELKNEVRKRMTEYYLSNPVK